MFGSDYYLKNVCVRGEISNVKYHQSGHIYFTLKDTESNISCIIWASRRSGLSFNLQDGLQVIIQGEVTASEKYGNYSLIVKSVTKDGIGLLYEKYEALKRELEESGMFDASYKKPLPKYIKRLGVVTAKTGAAIHDIIKVAKRRNPYVEIILYPATVQGDTAAPTIVKGIQILDKMGLDAIIVGRGGGSYEDLFVFNDKSIAEAVFNAVTPICSAVGHEVDTTIIDFVADVRAATPSEAAEKCVFRLDDVERTIDSLRENLDYSINRIVTDRKRRVENMNARLSARSPVNKLNLKKEYLLRMGKQLDNDMKRVLTNRQSRLDSLIGKLEASSPAKRLQSGFSHVAGADEKTVTSIKQVKAGEELTINVTDGIIISTVNRVNSNERN